MPAQAPSEEYLLEYIGYRLEATAIAFILINTNFVGLRYWSRRLQTTGFRFDDVLIVASYILINGVCINCICAVKLGDVGRHLEWVAIHPDKLKVWLKTCFIAAPAIYAFAVSVPKLAMLRIFLSVFVDKPARIACYVLAVILVITPLILAPISIFQCHPVSYLWNQYIPQDPMPEGSCLNGGLLFRYGSLPNIATDVAMLIIPLPTIWKLQVSRLTRIGLFLTFALSSIGLITSAIRFSEFFQSIEDGPWAAVPLSIWTIVEPSVYLVAACLLSLRPLLRFVFIESQFASLYRRTSDKTVSHGSTAVTSKQNWHTSDTELREQDTNSDKNLISERPSHGETDGGFSQASLEANSAGQNPVYQTFDYRV